MRILAFCDYYLSSSVGGAERVAAEIYPRLVDQHHCQVLVIGAQPPQALKVGNRGGELSQTIQAGLQASLIHGIDLSKILGGQLLVSPRLFGIACKAARSFWPDVIHINGFHFHSSNVGLRIARKIHVPTVATAHVGGFDAMPGRARCPAIVFDRVQGGHVARRATRIVAVSESVACHVVALGADPDRVSVARNGVDHVRFHAAATHIDAPWLRAVLVGRLIANKGTLLALDALSIARKSGRDVRLTIVGDGPMRGEVMSRIASPDLAGAVEMTGRVDNVEHWLRTADVSLRPSFTEGLPLAVLESLACGVPVVCSNAPGNLELVKHENNGLVIPIGDADALAKALIRLCDDRAILRAMSLAANVSVSHFTWEATARAHMDAFEKAAPCGWTVAP